MPHNKLFKYMLMVVLATIVSACATSPLTRSQGEAELLANQTPIISSRTSADERYDPTSELMYEVLTGELSGKLGDLEGSKEAYGRASELTDDPHVIERAMRIAIFAKDWPQALKVAYRWSDVLEGNIEAQQVLGILYLRKGDVDSSAKYFSNVMDAAAESPSQGYSIVAATLARVEDVDDSLELMRRLVAKNFTNPYGHCHMPTWP